MSCCLEKLSDMCDVKRFRRGITCEKDIRLGEEIDWLVALEGSVGVGEGGVGLEVFDVYE